MKKAIIIFEGHILLDEEDNNYIFCDIFCSILTCLMRLMKFMNGSMFIASKLSRLCAEFLEFFILFQTYCNIYIQPYITKKDDDTRKQADKSNFLQTFFSISF